MDWKAFFDELTIWLNQANQKFNEPDFWGWAVKSLGELGNRYDHPLTRRFLSETMAYLEGVYHG